MITGFRSIIQKAELKLVGITQAVKMYLDVHRVNLILYLVESEGAAWPSDMKNEI